MQLIETLPILNISVPAILLRVYNADSVCATVALTVKTTAKRMFNSFMSWICPYISRHLLSLNPLQAR
ncbi:hypothetical protein, partial [Shigella sonnei]|uniref:hypothetical protein n=1 Tax=Shigella sonnei TaxID=624 RepID=UPI002093FC1A